MTPPRAAGSNKPSGFFLLVSTAAAVLLTWPGAASQEFASPQGRAENVRFERTGAAITIVYDLVAEDAAAAFAIALEVSTDGGQTFAVKPRPENVSGDIGAAVKAGRGKRIVWEVGRDVETLQFDRFRFRVIAVSGAAKPVVRTGALQIDSDPPGAEFEIRGTTHRGKAGTTVSALPEGTYQVVFRLAGYLETMSAVNLRAGRTEAVRATLKLLPAPPPAPGPAPPPQMVEPKKGSAMKWILPVIGVAGAAGAAVALKGGGGSSTPQPPPPGPPAPVNPGPVTIACTSYSLSMSGFVVDLNFSESAGSQVVRLIASPSGCTDVWTTSSGVSFISVSPQTGTGNADVTVSVQANPGGTRNGTVTIAGQSFPVDQSSASCTYTFGNTGPGGDGFDQPFDNNPAMSLNSGSGTIFFTLTTQPGCVYRITKTGAPIFTNSATFTSTFSGRQAFGIQANSTSSNRTVVITFDAANGAQAKSFNICQFRGDQPNPPAGTRCR